MYESYWRLDVKPFENTPDPHFMYASTQHEEALMRMLYSVRERKQIALLGGEYGSGKTFISRVLLKDLSQDEAYKIVLIQNPQMTQIEFLGEILFQLGAAVPTGTRPEFTREVEKTLKDLLEKGKKVVLIVDEAQIIDESEFEQMRLLLNFQMDDKFLFTLLLLGQSDLIRKVDNVEPLRQRISMRYNLTAMDEKETFAYIKHRLYVAGRQQPIFSEGAASLIYQASQGIPRRINNICDHSLLLGYSQKSASIGVKIIEEAARDLGETLPDIGVNGETAFAPEPATIEKDDNVQDIRHNEERGRPKREIPAIGGRKG